MLSPLIKKLHDVDGFKRPLFPFITARLFTPWPVEHGGLPTGSKGQLCLCTRSTGSAILRLPLVLCFLPAAVTVTHLQGSVAIAGAAVAWLREMLGVIKNAADVERLVLKDRNIKIG